MDAQLTEAVREMRSALKGLMSGALTAEGRAAAAAVLLLLAVVEAAVPLLNRVLAEAGQEEI